MTRAHRPSHYTTKPSFRLMPEDYARIKGGRPKRWDQTAFGILFLIAILSLTLAIFIGWNPYICIPVFIMIIIGVLLAHFRGWLYG